MKRTTMNNEIIAQLKIQTARDLYEALSLFNPDELDVMYLYVNGIKRDEIAGFDVRESTLTDGSKVKDIHFLID